MMANFKAKSRGRGIMKVNNYEQITKRFAYQKKQMILLT